jgi:hypothetical protein
MQLAEQQPNSFWPQTQSGLEQTKSIRIQPREFGAVPRFIDFDVACRISPRLRAAAYVAEVLQPSATDVPRAVFHHGLSLYLLWIKAPSVYLLKGASRTTEVWLKAQGFGPCFFCRGFTSQMLAACAACEAEGEYRLCVKKDCLLEFAARTSPKPGKERVCPAISRHKGDNIFSPNVLVCRGKVIVPHPECPPETRQYLRALEDSTQQLPEGTYTDSWKKAFET